MSDENAATLALSEAHDEAWADPGARALPLGQGPSWGEPPLDGPTVKAIAQRARYFRRLWPRLSPDSARRIFHALCDDIDLLYRDWESYDIVEVPRAD